jgi:hypothetical protein
MIGAHAGLLAVQSLVFLVLYTALEFLSLNVMVLFDAPIGEPGVVSWKIVLPKTVVLALPATVLITAFLRAVADPDAPQGLRVTIPFYNAVFWRALVLSLLISAGGEWLNALGYVDPDRPEGPPTWKLVAGAILQIVSVLLALRLSPTLAAAAIGQPASLAEVWCSLKGKFLGFVVVFLGVMIPLYALSSVIGGIIFSISMMIEEHLIIMLFPFLFALGALAPMLAIAAVLAVTSLGETQE